MPSGKIEAGMEPIQDFCDQLINFSKLRGHYDIFKNTLFYETIIWAHWNDDLEKKITVNEVQWPFPILLIFTKEGGIFIVQMQIATKDKPFI